MDKANLELKHRCFKFPEIRDALREIGATKVATKKQKDYFFNLPRDARKNSPRLKLRIENKQQELIYYERPNFNKAKGAVADIKLYPVKDEQLLPFLKMALGVRAIVEKKREVWKLENTVFHLDNVKGVGGIFEIELQNHKKR
ncbi:MAG: class IV adenylate cyclase [Candidatus Paceibacterota bacterium]